MTTTTTTDATLSRHTTAALEHLAEVAAGEATLSNDPDWSDLAATLTAAAYAGTLCPAACRELYQHVAAKDVGVDIGRTEWRAIMADLCRAGYFEEFNPAVVRTRRPRLMTVDGKRYEV